MRIFTALKDTIEGIFYAVILIACACVIFFGGTVFSILGTIIAAITIAISFALFVLWGIKEIVVSIFRK